MSDNSLTPPRGDFEKAEKYINQLVDLINQNKIEAYHTDLKKFDPTSIRNHYTVSLKDYQIEISHSKHPSSDKDSYVMIFNNLRNLTGGSGEKVILAYVYISDSQFAKFKLVADRQLEEKRRKEEEKKFKEVMEPIDTLLDQVGGESKKGEPKPLGGYAFGDKPETPNNSLDSFDSSRIHQM